MATRIYVVSETTPEGVKESLVEAGNPSQAIRHKVKARFTAEAATSTEVARLMASGTTVEKASTD